MIGERPKVLAELNGRPFLFYLLDQLDIAGIQKAILCTGYLGEQVQQALQSTYRGLSLLYSQELTPLGTGGALRLALNLTESDVTLVMNGDSACEVDLSKFWKWHCLHKGKGSLVLTQVPDTSRYGRVILADDCKIQSFSEKVASLGGGYINAGIYLLSKSLLKTIPTEKNVSLELEMFPAWLSKGLYGYKNQGRFIDIGTPESYSEAGQFFFPRK